MVDIPTLIKRVDKYATRTGRTPGGVSRLIFDDAKAVEQLRGGARNFTIRRIEEAIARLTQLEKEARPSRRREPA